MGLKALSLSDHGSISGIVSHYKAVKEYNKKAKKDNKQELKFIAGNELYICHDVATIQKTENRNRTHMVVWAKNYQGWKDLIQLTSQTNHPDYYYYKPRIHLWDKDGAVGLQAFCKGNIAGCSGHQGSILSDILFSDLKKAYGQYKGKKTDYYQQFLKPDWLDTASDMAFKLQDLFGKGNFWIELQNELNTEDELALWIHPLIVDCLREVSIKTGIPSFASSDPHYPSKEDALDQRATVMIAMKETDQSVAEKLTSSDEMDLMVFFGSTNFYMHSYDEMAKNFTKEELEESNRIADQVEAYSIEQKPYIPKFSVPPLPKEKYLEPIANNSDKYLMYLCVEGAKKIKPWEHSEIDKQKYWDRLKSELDIIFKFGLSDYFLVVHDICMAADNRPADHSFDWQNVIGENDPIIRGPGRGSAAGCLISYFTGITGIDPVRHDLLFSRFFNAGRMSKDNISLPDIDLDFEVEGRDWIIDYMKYKYGKENTGQIITFHTIKGKAALKDIFRVRGLPNAFDLANEISECIEAESVIADDIEHMKKDGHEDYNMLRWSLDNSEQFQEWYAKEDLKPFLDQAMRCEGIKRGSGKHPSGVVIANEPLSNLFPMVYDPKTKSRIVGFDLKSAEFCGSCKIDILGVSVLSKLKMVQKLVRANLCKYQ